MVEKTEKSMMEKCISYFEKECSVTPVLEGTSITKMDSDASSYSTISFYLDVSGRSKMSLPLRLSISSKEALDHLLSAKCVEPLPSNVTMDKENVKEGEYYHPGPDYSNLTGDSSAQLTFEITTSQQKVLMNTVNKQTAASMSSSTASLSSATAASGVLVEGMQLLTSTIEQDDDGSLSLLFEAEVVVRVVGNKAKQQSQHARQPGESTKRRLQTGRLEVMAVLTHTLRKQNSKFTAILSPSVPNVAFQRGFQNALRHTSPTMEQYRLNPFFLHLSLADALAIRVLSVPGPQIGSTLVSLIMKHPNTHSEPVTITNIAMHPGHSRLDRTMLMVERAPKRSVSSRSLFSGVRDKDENKSTRDDMQSSRRSIKSNASRRHSYRRSNSNIKESRRDNKAEGGSSQQQNQYGGLIDMSKSIQWGYAPSAEPQLPLTLYPHDAFSTIINVDAMEHMKSRTFLSPISVTAVVGQFDGHRNNTTDKKKNQVIIIASADAQWTTGRLALEPSDAFRVEMQLEPNETFLVGKPFTIHLRVLNMSADARDMMLLVAKDADKGFGTSTAKRRTTSSSSANTAVVSEVNGYTFGVWGLMADKDDYHTFKLDRDQELLAIDAALLLGEVKGHHSVEAQLRFNPLREGTLSVPDMQLFDKRSRKWYYCTHKLSIVAHNNQKDDETEV